MLSSIITLYLKEHKLQISLFILLLLAEVGLTVLIPTWRTLFYGAIEAKNAALIAPSIELFIGLIGGLVLIQSVKGWLKCVIGLHLRSIITDKLLSKWSTVKDKVKVNFPDQRINQDANLCTVLSLGVISEVLISALIVIYLILHMHNVLLIGYALIYSAVAMVLSIVFHKPMVTKDINLQVAEADQRLQLAKKIDDYAGVTKKTLNNKFKIISGAYRKYIKIVLGYSIFNGLQNNLAILIPFVILLPMYFSGTIEFGELMGNVASFELIVINATIILNLYTSVINCLASWKRVKQFSDL